MIASTKANWQQVSLEDVLDYTQPTEYIVESTDYADLNETPVLTPGKSFILGYTDETKGVFSNLPTIIFDDFTTAFKYVDFPFKVKSSAMKMLNTKSDEFDIKFVYYLMLSLNFEAKEHKRYWISKYSKLQVRIPPLPEQKRIVAILDAADALRQKDQQLIDHYNQLSQSLFLDMFGDPVSNTKGWNTLRFFDVFNCVTGKKDSNAEVDGGKYPFFTCAKTTSRIDSYSFHCEALLLAGNNAAGKYDVKHYSGKFDAYQRTYVLQIKNSIVTYKFIKTVLEMFLLQLQSMSIGSSTKYLTIKILERINLIIPPISLQKNYLKKIHLVESQLKSTENNLSKSNDLFNCLLQKAFKGGLS